MVESSESFIFVVENDNLNKKNTRTILWKLGMEIFSQVSSWIVFPVIAALLIGKYLDKIYNTTPYLFLGCVAFAFFISILGIGKVVFKYAKKLNEESNQENKENGTYK